MMIIRIHCNLSSLIYLLYVCIRCVVMVIRYTVVRQSLIQDTIVKRVVITTCNIIRNTINIFSSMAIVCLHTTVSWNINQH